MQRFPASDTQAQQSLISMALGFLGITALIMLLPKTIKFMMRRFLFGIVGEVVAVVVSGLLAEKAVDWIGQEAHQHNGQHGVKEQVRF